jgi:HlyD family secretion protein
VENVQPQSTVSAQSAAIAASKTDVTSYIAAENTAVANVAEAKADLEQKTLDYNRAKELYQDQLIAKQDYDAKVAAYDMSVATLDQRKAAVAQAKAQTDSARGHMNQAVASQRANYDALDKTVSRAPFDGLVTNVPVREGETVVVGIQNAEGSTLMTLADMSVITAEVKVDETDIVNIALGQSADVSVDALPGKIFKGHVTEVGDQALLRTTGVATSQSTTGTEEAKDFKVVVTLDQVSRRSSPRPLLHRQDHHRAQAEHAHHPHPGAGGARSQRKTRSSRITARRSARSRPTGKPATLIQGVYVLVIDDGRRRVRFVPVTTGITGTTDIEVLSGVKSGDEIVTGTYKVLRILKAGTAVKRRQLRRCRSPTQRQRQLAASRRTFGEHHVPRIPDHRPSRAGPHRRQRRRSPPRRRHRHRQSLEDLRDGRPAGARSARRGHPHPPQRVRRHHGPLRLR